MIYLISGCIMYNGDVFYTTDVRFGDHVRGINGAISLWSERQHGEIFACQQHHRTRSKLDKF